MQSWFGAIRCRLCVRSFCSTALSNRSSRDWDGNSAALSSCIASRTATTNSLRGCAVCFFSSFTSDPGLLADVGPADESKPLTARTAHSRASLAPRQRCDTRCTLPQISSNSRCQLLRSRHRSLWAEVPTYENKPISIQHSVKELSRAYVSPLVVANGGASDSSEELSTACKR